MGERGQISQRIRHTHLAGFRCGEWATIVGIGQDGPRELYGVRFDDGVSDFWVVNDPSDPYEFGERMTPCPACSDPSCLPWLYHQDHPLDLESGVG